MASTRLSVATSVCAAAALSALSCAPQQHTSSDPLISVTASPRSATLGTGTKMTFSAVVYGLTPTQTPAVHWSVRETGGGTVDGTGVYTAPATPGTFHVVATSLAVPTNNDAATVTVVPDTQSIAVAVTPKNASVMAGSMVRFTAAVMGTTGSQSGAVTWSVQEQGGGTVDSTGLYTAPASTGTWHVIATSVADPSQSDVATVQVTATPVVAVSVAPKTAATTTGGALTFSAMVTGTVSGQSTGVTWAVQESGGGTVDSSGRYTAPASAGTYHVVATGIADASKKDTATVTVTSVAVAISPKTAATTTGGALTFTATVTGTVSGQSTGVTWSVQESGGGTVDTSGHYTAPVSAGTFHVIATSIADPGKSDTATVTVTAIAVAISPKTAAATTGGTLNFSATVTGTVSGQSIGVTWSVQETGGGTVGTSGQYTAPASAGTFHVIATSIADPGKSDTATVTVSSIAVAILPKTAATTTGGALTFTATVTGTVSGQSTGVTWSVQESGGGTVDTSGHYTAPASAGTYHVVATSIADVSKKDTATVTVTSIAVAISPKTAATTTGGALTFTATVTGTLSGQSTGVTWSVQESGGGTVDASGHYTAPSSAGTFHVVATSIADVSKKDTATVTVTSVAVAISPKITATTTGGALTFTATVTGTVTGQSTGVTWSVQETGGGTVDTSGHYTAPASVGTFHVVATSIADASKNDTATVTVTVPTIAVSVSPQITQTSPGGVVAFAATVTGATGGQSTAVTWFVQEGATGGSVDASGNYTAPSAEGTYHVVATSVADATKNGSATVTVTTLSFIPADRLTTWNPGVQGGIPNRTAVCGATVNASTFGNGASDAAAGIQAAIDACPAGQVVQLSAGTFTINSGGYLLINKGITLRGAGPGQTTLQKTNGAKPGQEATGPNPSPLIIVGPARWANNSHGVLGSVNLTADAVKEANSVTVASTTGLSAGKVVLLDELSGAIWQADPAGRGQIWASPDWRVVWQRHNPSQGTDDPFPSAASWFSRNDRPTSEVKQIDHLSGNTVFFTTPIHISYRASQTAQLAWYEYAHVQNAGVEELTLIGGDNGQLRFQWAANCWAKRVENTVWHDEGFSIEDSVRIEIRDSYVHDAAWAQPGGAGYAISLASGSAEVLVENSISVKANKVMVARSAGAGSVFGYNYVDDGYINTNTGWIEVGLNASHMVGPHHVLFEGNYGFNWDSDKTHGSAIYHTIFRNHLRGVRSSFNDSTHGPRRCAGATYYSYWHTFVGNVLGAAGQMTGWVYQSGDMDTPAIWMFGWDDWSPYPSDPKVAATVLRHGNFDYVTNAVNWDPSISNHTLPPSLYLAQKPAFFNAGSGYVWPWVDPTGTQKLYTLPAKARFDAGTPFVQP